jgi:uncharacterized protein
MELNLEAAPWLFLTKPGARLEPQEGDADILMADKPLSLSGLVEDELLLALPMVPMHAPDQCTAKVRAANVVRAAPERAERGRKNPFAVLDQLKKTK